MAALELLNNALAVTGAIDYPLSVTTTDRLSAIGQMVFTVFVGSPGAASCVPGQYVRWSDGGYEFTGIVETVTRAAQADGSEVLTVTCAHIARELAWWSAMQIKLAAGTAPATVTAAIAAIMLAGPNISPWTVTAAGAVGALTIYLQNDGASQFALLGSVAEKVGAWLVRGAGRSLSMTATWAASGITARVVTGDKPANVAALLALSREESAAEIVTWVFPFTAGNAAVRVGVEMATAALPGGYAKVARSGNGPTVTGIRHSAALATFGERERFIQFPDINPLSNSAPDIISAANALQAATVNWLANQARVRIAYSLTVDDAPAPVMPGQSLTVQAPDLDATLYCVEATHTWAPGVPMRSQLRVTDGGPWVNSGAAEQIRAMEAARVYRAHAQLAPNVYQLSYNKPVDAQYGADFRFRFDEGITQVLFVALDVQLQPLQSTVRAIGAAGVKTSVYTVPDHNHSFDDGGHTHTTPNHQHSMTFAGHTHFGGVHTHSIATIAHVHQIEVTKVSTAGSDFNDVRLNSASPNNFQVTAGSGLGSIVTTPTTSTGGAGTDTGNGGNVATQSGLIGTFNTNGGEGAGTTGTGTADGTTSLAGGDSHSHSVDVPVAMEYGIFRDSAANTFALADLEYQINSGAWATLTGAVSLGDGWYRIALTNALIDLATFYPLNKSNKVTVRAVAISAAVETFVVAAAGVGQFNRWNDAGAYQQQVTGTAGTALALSPNGWLYVLRKAAGTVTIYSAAANGTLALWDTWTLSSTGMNAITVDVRTGSKWYAGDAGYYGKDGATPNIAIAGGAVINYIAAFGGRIYFSTASNTLVMVTDFVGAGASQSGVTSAPIAARNDGTIVQCSSMAAGFALRVWQPDLSASTTCTRSDTGNAWTPLSIASAANLVHVGCSDGRVRTYVIDVAAGTATLAWTSTGTPGTTGYPASIGLLGVSAVLSPKAANIDAQLTVRSVVQAIVMN